jgi:hypothetical protein
MVNRVNVANKSTHNSEKKNKAYSTKKGGRKRKKKVLKSKFS